MTQIPSKKSRRYLKKRILARLWRVGFYPPEADKYQGGREGQTTGIHQYFEDLNRAPNTESGPKDFFEMASNLPVAVTIWLLAVGLLLMIACPPIILADTGDPNEVPDRYGLSANVGNTYDPSTKTGFAMLSGFALYDYDRIWPHAAPDPLRFKVEASAGSTWTKDKDFMAAVSIFALYYLDRFAYKSLRPYVEGGIGGIYTQWKGDGQGSHLNFNPQVGIGTEFSTGYGGTYLAAVRLHHFSNAGLNDDNRGVNSIVFVIGRFF